jgi:hypothetical protein
MMRVSPEFFGLLGLGPVAGRLLGAADGQPAAAPAVVAGYGFWQRTSLTRIAARWRDPRGPGP